MPRARTKADLLKFAAENYEKLTDLISRMTEAQLNTPFDFSDDANKKEAHWSCTARGSPMNKDWSERLQVLHVVSESPEAAWLIDY